MASIPTAPVSREEYLARDLEAERKLELVNGVVVAMAGASPRHNLVVNNINVFLFQALRDRCTVLVSDQRVRVDPTGAYVYPDVVVGRGELHFTDERPRSLTNPTLVVEVISKSTEDHDRGAKVAHYRKLPSVREIVIVEPNEPRLEVWRRLDSGDWLVADVTEGAAELESLSVTLPIEDVYAGVDRLPPDEPAAEAPEPA